MSWNLHLTTLAPEFLLGAGNGAGLEKQLDKAFQLGVRVGPCGLGAGRSSSVGDRIKLLFRGQ